MNSYKQSSYTKVPSLKAVNTLEFKYRFMEPDRTIWTRGGPSNSNHLTRSLTPSLPLILSPPPLKPPPLVATYRTHLVLNTNGAYIIQSLVINKYIKHIPMYVHSSTKLTLFNTINTTTHFYAPSHLHGSHLFRDLKSNSNILINPYNVTWASHFSHSIPSTHDHAHQII